MKGLELKREITKIAIEQLEELHSELLDEANLKMHTGGDSEDDSIVHGSFGETGSEDMSKETAQLRMKEASQLAETIRTFKNYKFEKEHSDVGYLSLIQSNRGYFFVSKAVQSVRVDNIKYNLIGMEAPIYKALEGCKRGDKIQFNSMDFVIENVV